jgi:hypothetical protein
MRAGDAYVGITVKPAPITALKRLDPTRYAHLSMPNPADLDQRCAPYSKSSDRDSEDGLAWDIISQVGRLTAATHPRTHYVTCTWSPALDYRPADLVSRIASW